jgi:hypothetical protein
LNRRIEFAEAGEGVHLELRNRDFRALHGKFGSSYVKTITDGLLDFDVAVIETMLAATAKKDGESFALTLDFLEDVPLELIQLKLIDALSIAINGRTFADFQATLDKRSATKAA